MNRSSVIRSRISLPGSVGLCFLALSGCGDSGMVPEPAGREAVRIDIEPAVSRLANPGDSVKLLAFGVLEDGSLTDLPVSWMSDAEAVATIDANGVVTAVETGITTIRATTGTISGVATVAVDPDTLPPELVTVGVSPTRVQMRQGVAVVRVTAEFSDDRSGVKTALATFDGPQGPTITGVVVLQLLDDSGSTTTFRGFIGVSAPSGVGVWTLSTLRASDGFHNVSKWGARDLALRGLDVQFEVIFTGEDS